MDNIKLTDIKIPGVLWVLLISIVVVVAEHYGLDPALVTVGITLVFAVAKYVNVGTADVEHLLDLLRQVNQLLPVQRGRGSPTISQEIEDATPNKAARWLVG